MSQFFSKLNKIARQVRGFFPEALPTGMTAFNAFADSIAATYSLPTSKQRDVRWMVATLTVNHKRPMRFASKWYYASHIRAASVKEIAGAAMMAAQEEARQERIKASQATEATVTAQVADGSGQTPLLVN